MIIKRYSFELGDVFIRQEDIGEKSRVPVERF
jgi:hypothetical protein